MAKKKKPAPIDPRLVVRPRLDALFDRYGGRTPDLDGLQAAVEALMAQAGHRPVMEALVKRMEGTPEAERETLMLLVERLRRPEVVDYLWQLVKKPRALSIEAKTTALVILNGMGEAVDLSDPGRYFSERDFKPGDLRSTEALVRSGLRGIARHLRGARDPVEVERLMLDINRLPEAAPDGEGILLSLIEEAEAEATDLGADFLLAMARATPYADAAKAASSALARLEAQGIRPVTPAVLNMGQEKFFAAYMTDPQHPWQQSVNVAWECAPGTLQVLVFLLDFGAPWRGAIKDMFATAAMTPGDYRRQFVTEAERQKGDRVYRVSLKRAQAAIAAALVANHKNKIALPDEFKEMRHLVERWVLHPPAASLEADQTEDELAHLPVTVDHEAAPLLLDLSADHLADLQRVLPPGALEALSGGPREFASFKALQKDVASLVQVLEGPLSWPKEWLQDYLASLHPAPEKLEQDDPELKALAQQWDHLAHFLDYLDVEGYDVHAPADLRGFHFAEYLAAGAPDAPPEVGQARLETIRGFFEYLAQAQHLPPDAPALSALARMLAQPDELALDLRPAPLGGEVAVWLRAFGADERDEPLTYNEWWAALVLDRKFKGRWDKFRRAAGKFPDAEAKQAVLDRLEGRLAEDPDYLDYLFDERPPEAQEYKRAEHWFERESVSQARAW